MGFVEGVWGALVGRKGIGVWRFGESGFCGGVEAEALLRYDAWLWVVGDQGGLFMGLACGRSL